MRQPIEKGGGMRIKILGILLMAGLLSNPLWGAELARSHGEKTHKIDPEYKVVATPELEARGLKLFGRHCARCHYADRLDGRRGPGLKGLYERKFTPEMKHPVTDANIRNHIVRGGRSMPAFDDLKPGELEAIISFLKTL
jgi:mono/diheme cytochrome c family protein